VLSIGKLVGGAEDYYLSMVARGREEYYTGAGESPGTWLGSGTIRLGLAGEVSAEDLRAILAGISPRSGTELGLPRRAGPRVAGFDLTFSAPKSVSLLYALGSPGQSAAARAAHKHAVSEGVDYLERHALFARRGDGGQRRIGTSGLVGAAFVHRTSRNGDPQLHTHVLAANAVEGVDGRWSAPDARGLYFHAQTAGYVYQASLRAGLVRSLGVSFGPVRRGAAELAGVDATVLRRFSTRRAEIEEYLAAFGGTSGRTAEIAALATREPKAHGSHHAPDSPELRAQWRLLAHEHGVDPDRLFAEVGRPRRVELGDSAIRELAATLLGPEGLTAQDSTFERRDVVREVAESLVDGGDLDSIEAAVDYTLRQPEAVALERMGRGVEPLHTTRQHLDIEAGLIETAVDWRDKGAVALEPALVDRILARRSELSAEQRAMVRSLVSSGHGIEVVVGKAGAGKTTALSLAREIFKEAGWSVWGTALSARAAEELVASAGIESVTLARFLGQLDQGDRLLGPKDVVVVDEAGMVGTRTLAALVEAAHEAGSKLVLVGDPRQLPEIEAGGAFGALAVRLGPLELTENRRQHERWERIALDQLRSGDVVAGLAAYEDHGRIRLAGTMTETRRDLVDRWLDARDRGDGALMLAVNRRDVAALNRQTRHVLQHCGSLGADLVEGHGRSFALGDEVVCLRNARRLGVINGTRGTVVEVVASSVVIDTSAGPRSLPLTYLDAGHLDHGYASTVHKAQGATYDRAFVLATESLTREAGYVAMSRARLGTELFVTAGAFEQGLGPEAREVEPLARTAARLAVSRAKVLASSHLEDGPTDGYGPAISAAPGRGRGPGNPELAVAPETGRRAARRVESTPDELRAVDHPGSQPPAHVAVLGPRPDSLDERARYDRLTDAINRYRVQYEVDDGDDPLGPRPFEARARLAHDVLAAEIRRYEPRRGRQLEPPGLDLGWGR
jgi:conjugative relaxase-like TrwC/TraI family protein